MKEQIFITRAGQRWGPYSQEQCQQMLAAGQLVPMDMAWRQGMPDWRPLGEVVPNTFQIGSAPMVPLPTPSNAAATVLGKEETTAEIIGKMGCGCLLWIGLVALALGGGVVFPVLLIILPFAAIGGIIDLVKKLSKLSKRRQRDRHLQ